MAAADHDPIVVFIANETGPAERLIREHANDGSGRCPICTSGPQAGRVRWPCRIYDYAIRARVARRERAAHRMP